MTASPADAFSDLLAQERAAALQANVEKLLEIQDAKRAVMDNLKRSSEPEDRIRALSVRAQDNIDLLRHLVHCLRSISSIPEKDTYTAAGQFAEASMGNERGTV